MPRTAHNATRTLAPAHALTGALTLTATLALAACGAPTGGAADAGADAAPGPFDDCPAAPLTAPNALPLERDDEAMCALQARLRALPPRAVVCSGEDSHGIVESHTVHAALARYFARARGARTIAMELPDADLARIDAYLETGDEASLSAYFADTVGTAAYTRESAEFFRALRAFSMTLPGGERIKVRGIDVAVTTRATYDRLLAFYAVDPDVRAQIRAQCLRTGGGGAPARLEQGAMLLDQLIEGWPEARARYASQVSEEALATAFDDLQNLRDGYRFLVIYNAGDFMTADAMHREPALARNLASLAERVPTTLLVIAHNEHCGRGTVVGDSPSLGARSTMLLPDRYHVVAQVYGGGTQRQRNASGAFVSAPVGRGTLGRAVQGLSMAPAFLFAPSQSGYDGMTWYISEYGGDVMPTRDFDTMLFLRTVTAATEFAP